MSITLILHQHIISIRHEQEITVIIENKLS